jgi:hypothetical protein
VLGRLAVALRAPVRTGVPHVVVAWSIGSTGRVATAGSAVYADDARPLAVARATWVSIAGRPAPSAS